MGTLKWGAPTPDVLAQIENAGTDTLTRWTRALLSAATWDEALQAPQSSSSPR